MTNENDAISGHHDFSPSKLQQFKECPGSYKMQFGLPDNPTPESDEGTRIHAAVATGDLSGLNHAEEELARGALEFLESIASGTEMKCEMIRERPVKVLAPNGGMLTEGTADVIVRWEDGHIEVIDWKFGYRAVPDASVNIQTAAYALGAMQEFGVSECTAHIWQPRLKRHSVYTFRKPEAILANIRGIVSRCQSEKVTLCPGDACTYCRAKGRCPAFQSRFRAVAIAEPVLPADDAALAELYERSKIAEKYIAEIKKAVETRMDANGGRCAHLVFKEIPGRREISDISQAHVMLDHLLTPSEFLSCCKASVTGLVDAASAKLIAQASVRGDKLTKTKAKAEIEELLEETITRANPTRQIVGLEVQG